jgi:hypothetical protein
MAISVAPRNDGKLVISCGNEAVVYDPEEKISGPDGIVYDPVSSGSKGKPAGILTIPRRITPGGPAVTMGLVSGPRSNFELAFRLVETVEAFDSAVTFACSRWLPEQGSLKLGWRASEPLQIAELHRVLAKQPSVPFDIEICPITG